MGTSGVFFGSLKTFLRSAQLQNMRVATFLVILFFQNSKTKGESIFSCHFLRSNPGVTHCKKKLKFKLLYFQNKACHRAEDRSADISLKCLSPDKGKNSKVFIVVFSDVT